MKTLALLCFGNSLDWFPGPEWSFLRCVCLLFKKNPAERQMRPIRCALSGLAL